MGTPSFLWRKAKNVHAWTLGNQWVKLIIFFRRNQKSLLRRKVRRCAKLSKWLTKTTTGGAIKPHVPAPHFFANEAGFAHVLLDSFNLDNLYIPIK